MRSKRPLLLIVCLALSACVSQAQVLWEKTWGGPYDDGCEVRNTRDGGMIAMGTFGLDSWLMRLDLNGDTLWTKRISQPLDLCAITETLDGGFLATGTTRTQNRDILAWKFDLRGDSIWMKVYADTLSTEGNYTVLLRPDSSFVITGYTSANGYDMLVMHIDSVGNLLWRNTYGGPGFEGGTMAAPTSDGGYILTTTGGSPFFSNIWVAKIDSAGDTVWTRNYLEVFPTGGSVPKVTAQGNILIMGWIQPGDFDNYLLCLDPQGNPLWTQHYLGIGFESRTARGVIEDRWGGYTFVSSVDVGYGPLARDHDIAIFRLDSLGAVTQIHRVGHLGHEMPRYFEQTANGDYLIFGYSTSFAPMGQQTYLARLHPGSCGEFFYDLAGPQRVQICPSDTFLLDGGSGFTNYLWTDGDTNQIRRVTVSDTFYVQTTDSQGCTAYSSTVVVDAKIGPQFTWTAAGNLSLQFDGMLGDGMQSAWDFGDGGIDSTEDPLHTYSQAGTYYVCFQSLIAGCGWEQSCDSVTVANTIGVATSPPLLPQIFPNPNNGRFYIMNPSPMQLNYEVIDVSGEPLHSGVLEGDSDLQLDLTNVAQGVYLLQIQGEQGRYPSQRLVIIR